MKTLSEKRIGMDYCPQCKLSIGFEVFPTKDVKEFIKDVDDLIKKVEDSNEMDRIILLFKLRSKIKERAGSKLIK